MSAATGKQVKDGTDSKKREGISAKGRGLRARLVGKRAVNETLELAMKRNVYKVKEGSRRAV